MKISVARQDPLSLPLGEQPAGRLCRQYTNVGSSAMEALECPGEKQRLWWTRLGPDFTTDPFPCDDHLMSSFTFKDATLMKERQSYIKPPLLLKRLPGASDQQQQFPAQVILRSIQGQCHDHKESVEEHFIHGDADMAMEQSIDHRHADLSSSDEEPHSQSSILISECRCEHQPAEDTSENLAVARVKLMCSFGGRIMARPIDGKLRYVGGETRIVAVCKDVRFAEFMSKMAQFYGVPLGLKYQLPDEDLDALVSVSSDDDLQNMMEEYDKVGSSGGTASRLRLFFFSTPAEIEVADVQFEGEDGSTFPEQRYVDAINGVSGKLHANLSEEDATGFRHMDVINTTEGGGGVPPLEQVNEVTQCSGPSPSPSSPLASGQPFYRKPPGLLDNSLQNLNESLGKVSIAPLGLEGDVEQEALVSSSGTPSQYHYDHPRHDSQFVQVVDSPRTAYPEGSASRYGENRLGLRPVDSQSKLVRLPDHHSEYRTSLGGPLEHWHEAPYLQDAASPQGDYQRPSQQHVVSLPSLQQSHHHQHQHHQLPHPHPLQHQHHHQHQQQYQHQQQQQQQHHHHHHHQHQHQQSWYSSQNDGDVGRGEHPHLEVHKQSQIGHQHHQHPLHHLHQNVSVHDGCSWNAEHHGIPRTHPSTQILHGLAPAPPYQMGSTPSSPRVAGGSYDFQGKCACGLQHSQVHRGISVSIGEQSFNRRPPFQGDQCARKRNSSRFYDNNSYGTDALAWQQPNHSLLAAEAEHKERANHWPPNHARHTRDFQSTECQVRNRNLQFSEAFGHSGENTTVPDRAEISKRCMCSNCADNRRQHVEMTVGHTAYSEVPDQTSDWFLLRKGSDVESGRGSVSRKVFPQVSVFKDEEQHDLDERLCEVESGICVSQLAGDSDSRRALVKHIDRGKKSQLPQGAMTGRFGVPDEPPMPSAPRASDRPAKQAWAKTFLESTIPWNVGPSELRNCCDVTVAQQGQAPLGRDLQTMNVISSSPAAVGGENLQAEVCNGRSNSLLYFHGDKFSDGVGKVEGDAFKRRSAKSGLESGNKAPILEMDDLEQQVASPVIGMSVTGALADSVASSVLDCCSDEVLTWEMLDTDRDGTFLDSQTMPKEADNVLKVQWDTKMGSVEPDHFPETEGNMGGPSLIKVNTSSDCIEAVPDKFSAGNNCLEDTNTEDLGAIPTVLSGESNKTSSQDKVPEAETLNSGERKEPSLSEAEAEAIARGLQIIKNSDLEDMKELGSGTYGTVYHGKWRGSDVAIKRIKASCFTGPPSERERLMADFWREACTLGQLHHPNVVAFYGVVPDGPGGTLATVTEYMVNGSLKQVLQKKDRTIDRRKRLFIAMDAAFGMEYLHSKNIVHFDLKCENLLVNMRDAHRPICKVGDFGLSKVKHHTLVSGGVRGTLPWMAPELMSGNCSMVSDKVDVFSFGIVMWELLTGEEPYANMHCGAIIGGIVNNTLRPSIPSWCDPGWRSLMERCWSGNPAERPPFAEVARELRAIAATMNLK
ncbi:hypothetical protein L7F22_023288 [Adiantum nelumboides]|nr:hypothetical protein [Adiantum nelumboides]